MYTQITVYCPRCKGHNIKKNGFDDNQKQRYACKDCTRRFIGDHHLTCKGLGLLFYSGSSVNAFFRNIGTNVKRYSMNTAAVRIAGIVMKKIGFTFIKKARETAAIKSRGTAMRQSFG